MSERFRSNPEYNLSNKSLESISTKTEGENFLRDLRKELESFEGFLKDLQVTYTDAGIEIPQEHVMREIEETEKSIDELKRHIAVVQEKVKTLPL